MKTIKYITAALIFVLSLSGCNKNPYETDSENTINLEMSKGSKEDIISSPQKWHITNKRICVILGYAFNEKDKVQEMTDLLSDRYGLAEDGGLISIYVYPEDFKSGGRSYWNNLRLMLQNDFESLDGLIILGAPERTHLGLARNQDYWDMNVPYPVIALFPQDDVLGLESTCDIVLDKSQAIKYNGEVLDEAHEETLIPEAPEILTDCIDYIVSLDGTFARDKSLSNHVFNMFEGHQVHHYSDPETGLQSVNHFVLN